MAQMNKQEALKFFSNTELKFVGYFKHVFTYEGEKDGIKVLVNFGGDSSDIYREEFAPVESFYDVGFEYFQVLKSNKNDNLLYQFSEN